MNRVLLLNYEFPPVGGGGGVAAKALAKGFIKNGYAVDYVTTKYGEQPEFEVVDGINVYRVSVWGRNELATATFFSLVSFPFCAYRTAAKLCREHEYSFINTHFAIPTGPLGVWISRKFKLKNILSIHGGDIYDPTKALSPHNKWYLRAVVNWVLRNSTKIVAQSSNTKENAQRYYKPGKPIEIIPLPYEPFIFKPATRAELDLKDGIFYTISVGRLVKRKGFDFLIRSIALSKDENVHALIIGEGPERASLEALARELGVEHRVHLLGAVGEEKKFQYYSNADVFVLSSVHEGFGIVLQEAMQVGLPIVSTDNGGQTDLVRDGENGYLILHGDSKTLIEKIQVLKADAFLRDKLSSKDRESIDRFSLETVAMEYANNDSKISSETFFDLQKNAYKKLAHGFDEEQNRDNRNHQNKIRAINQFLDIQDGDKVLEIGVGTGIHAKYILEFNKGKNFEFYGVDISEDMLSETKKKLGDALHLQAMAGEDLKFGSNFFDKAYISGSLHHFDNPEKGISELIRVLKPGGKFCIMEPNILFPTNLYAANTIPEEVHMKLMRRSNFKRWLDKHQDVNYDLINFAYTPPIPVSFISFYDYLDRFFSVLPLVKRVSVMLLVRGQKTSR